MNLKKGLVSIILIIILSLTFYLSKTYTLKDSYLNFINILTFKFQQEDKELFKIDFLNLYIKSLKNHNHFLIKEEKPNTMVFNENTSLEQGKDKEEAMVYLYSTHSNEEYSYEKSDIYSIIPTVKTASYILESELNKLGIKSLVENKNTIDILNSKNMKYSESYKISRTLLEQSLKENPNLKYFIDVHRDSVKRNITTTEINGVSYARIMFVLGLENENYQENKSLMQKLDNYLNENYEGLSRGIYEKQGVGVNGVYNQDFSPNTILIEFGGVDNTILEVANSVKVVAEALYNVINEDKTTKLE